MIYAPWTYQVKPLLGAQPNRAHPLCPDYAWLFNEASGAQAFDVASGKVGTFPSDVGWKSTSMGPAADFNGANGTGIGMSVALKALPFAYVWWCEFDVLPFQDYLTMDGNITSIICGYLANNFELYTFWRSYTALPIPTDGMMHAYAYVWDAATLWCVRDGVVVKSTSGFSMANAPAARTLTFLGSAGGGNSCIDGRIAGFYIAEGQKATLDFALGLHAQPFGWLQTPSLVGMYQEAVPSGHPALRRLGLLPTGFEFDRSGQTRWV